MVGNAVPVNFAEQLALKIKSDLKGLTKIDRSEVIEGEVIGPDFGAQSNGIYRLF
jgi:hypothetical protein